MTGRASANGLDQRAFLQDLVRATHHLGLEIYEQPNFCIHSTLALVDVLEALEIPARPLRVEAKVFNFALPHGQVRGCVLGGDGDGSFRPKSEGWRGHLCVLAGEQWLLDPTLPQAGYGAVPMAIEVDAAFLRGEAWLKETTGSEGAEVQYRMYQRQNGWLSKPAARWTQRIVLVDRLIEWVDSRARRHPSEQVF